MSTGVGADAGNVVGNVYDKYGTRNPFARALMRGFLRAVGELYAETRAESVLEVGCGEGRLAHHLVTRVRRPARFEACDVALDRLAPDLDPSIVVRQASVYELPHADREFDLVICCEVLEHLSRPEDALAELARTARTAVLLSTPREPLWRLLNLARGRYLRAFGNTPGHVQAFGRGDLIRLAESRLRVTGVRTPLPWTVLIGEPRT